MAAPSRSMRAAAAGPGAHHRRWSSAATWCRSASRRAASADATSCASRAPTRYTLDQLPRAQSALVSLEPDNGALRALVGGFSFAAQQVQPRRSQARRQPGSSFKPFLYAAAFERGFNPASIVLRRAGASSAIRRAAHLAAAERRPAISPARCACAKRWCSRATWCRCGCSMRSAWITRARYISHFGIDESLLPPNLSMSLGTASLRADDDRARLRDVPQRRLPDHAVVHR